MPQTLTILIVDSNDDRRAAIEQAVAGLAGAECHSMGLIDPQEAPATIDELAPTLVVVGAATGEEDAFAFLDHVSNAKPQVGYAIASAEDSTELVMRAMRSGADEFFKLPPAPEDIEAAVGRILARKSGQKPSGEGQIITVFSGKGGCGATMLATNLAINMATEVGQNSTVIVDLNLQLGDVGTFMDVRPRFTIADATKEVERLDEELLKSFLSPHPSGALVLACPNEADEAEAIMGEHLVAVLKMLRKMHRFVIVDTVHAFNDHSLAALDNSDTILLVTDMLVPSIRNAQRCLSVFKELGYADDAIKVVINRFYRGASVSLKDLRKAMERTIAWLLPNDFGTVTSAIDSGLPLSGVAPRSEIAGAILGLSQSLAGVEPEAVKSGGLSRVFSSLLGK